MLKTKQHVAISSNMCDGADVGWDSDVLGKGQSGNDNVRGGGVLDNGIYCSPRKTIAVLVGAEGQGEELGRREDLIG